MAKALLLSMAAQGSRPCKAQRGRDGLQSFSHSCHQRVHSHACHL
jgi:hypothetical protein